MFDQNIQQKSTMKIFIGWSPGWRLTKPRMNFHLKSILPLWRRRCHDVEGRRDQVDLDGDGLGRQGQASPEGGLDGVDALVRETAHLNE